MQIVGTITAPTPFVAANFIILDTIIFCCLDIICLIVQAMGGLSAAHAANTKTNASMGANIMLRGISAQIFAIVVYVTLAVETLLHLQYNLPLRHVGHGRIFILEKSQRAQL
ncbi:hypothetical protein BDR06DRAFT_309282 [Suillus hirtellus]|nr:hypothetical protein BDR06DRAFT_309282 [Suillus hirtellus]